MSVTVTVCDIGTVRNVLMSDSRLADFRIAVPKNFGLDPPLLFSLHLTHFSFIF